MGAPAFELPNMMVGFWPANVDMSAEPTPGLPTFQFTTVSLEAPASGVGTEAGAALNLASAGFPILGILQDNPRKGVEGSILAQGISKARIGVGGCGIMQRLMADGLGNLIPWTTGNDAVAFSLCVATAGAIVPVFLIRSGRS